VLVIESDNPLDKEAEQVTVRPRMVAVLSVPDSDPVRAFEEETTQDALFEREGLVETTALAE
jgi:hypothetical protein